MGTNNKFTRDQRKIVWKIRDLKVKQTNARKRWLNLDIGINQLQNELSGNSCWGSTKKRTKGL